MKQRTDSTKIQRTRRVKINSIEHKRWAAYATAALASSFSLANSAEAEIHYSGPINQEVGDDSSFTFPLGGSGGVIQVTHFRHFYGSSSVYDGGTALFRVYAPSGAVRGVETARHIEVSVSRLIPQDVISAGPFVPTTTFPPIERFFLAERSNGGGLPRGQFQEREPGFVGFKFNTGAGDQYGWARVRMRGFARNRFVLVDYAYGDPGDVVLAGQRGNSDPTMNSLGGLALGAAGLLAWRRRRANQRAAA